MLIKNLLNTISWVDAHRAADNAPLLEILPGFVTPAGGQLVIWQILL
jgi:hypothetical protein